MRRYDLYGFRAASLEAAAALIADVLGVRLDRRDSSYRGIYYSGGAGSTHDYLLVQNTEESRWHREYPDYGATLMVSDQPDMDAIRQHLTSGRSDPAFLRSIVHAEDPPGEWPPPEPEA